MVENKCFKCEKEARYVASFDDRHSHQRDPGSEHFKPVEIVFRCEDHAHSSYARMSLFYSRSQLHRYEIDEEKLKIVGEMLEAGEAVLG